MLVGDEASSWLTAYLQLAEQLEELGIVYAEGQAVYVEFEEGRHV